MPEVMFFRHHEGQTIAPPGDFDPNPDLSLSWLPDTLTGGHAVTQASHRSQAQTPPIHKAQPLTQCPCWRGELSNEGGGSLATQ